MSDFEKWLRDVQRIPIEALDCAGLAVLRQEFDEGVRRDAEWRAQRAPSRSVRTKDRRYAIAIEDDNGLGLSFWIKRSWSGIFLISPRDSEWDPHASYHRDGTYHQRSYGVANGAQKRQPLDATFQGEEHLGAFLGHGSGPRIGCNDFDDVFIAPPGVLTGTTGKVVVDLVEPGGHSAGHHREILRIIDERIYRDASPWIVVALAEDRVRLL